MESLVAEGGFGVVYRAHHLGLDARIALKCLKLPARMRADERDAFLKAFVDEGRLLHQLSRATVGIVQALDVGADTSPNGAWTPYIALEWLEGTSLEDDLAARAQVGAPGRALAEAVALLEPAARALAVAHERSIAHRDIKPANLFITEVGGRRIVKVLDFGIAKVMTESSSLTRALQVTGASMQAFTPQYGAPEQFDRARFGATGPWTDVFALALVLVEVLSGKPALDGGDTTQYFVSAIHPERRPTPRQAGVHVTDAVEAVMARAVAVHPRDRFHSAGQFWDALVAAAADASSAALAPATTPDAAVPPARTELSVPLRLPADPRRAPSTTTAPHMARGIPPSLAARPTTILRRRGCVIVIATGTLLIGSAVGAFLVIHGSTDSNIARRPADRGPLASEPPAPSSTAPSVPACEQPCCGGAGCVAESDDVRKLFDKFKCGPGGRTCTCGSGLACVPGSCRSTMQDGEFELRLAGVGTESKVNACGTALGNGRVCVRKVGATAWQCARIGQACNEDAGAKIGGARIGPAGMFVTTSDLTSTGLEVFVESEGHQRLACLDNGKHTGGIFLIGECVGVSYGSLHQVAGTTIDSVTFHVTPASPRTNALAPGVELDQTPGSTANPTCMSCVFLVGQVSCDSRDDRCTSGCFTHSDCCAHSTQGLLGNWKNYSSCKELGLDDPRCPR